MRKLLLPFNFVYRFFVFIRNKLYDHNYFKRLDLETIIVSVGNLSAGGSGKTPLVQLITEYILNKGKFIAVVTKGYKRTNDDIKVAEIGFENKNNELTVDNFGDESLLLLNNLTEYKKIKQPKGRGILVVSDDKSRGAKFAYKKFKPDIIIIDDAFQHRKLNRDLDIVLITNTQGKYLLPAGNLREPFASLRRADMVVLNKKFEEKELKIERERILMPVFKYEFKGYYGNNTFENSFSKKKAILFCGIADPESFETLLRNDDVIISNSIIFSDHHNFSIEDINKITDAFNKSKSDVIITTEKDYVRLVNRTDFISNKQIISLVKEHPLYYAKIKMITHRNEDFFINKIEDVMK